jgi:hypothetical protein
MRLDVIDARRCQPFGLLCGFGRRARVDAAEADLHRIAGGRRGEVRDPGAADETRGTDDLAFAYPVPDGQTVGERRPEVDFGRDAGHQQLLRDVSITFISICRPPCLLIHVNHVA